MASDRRRTVFRGRVLDVGVEEVELPNGVACSLEVVRHGGAAAVVPLTADGDVVLVRQFRHAAGGWLLEVPAGKLDAGERPIDCARRELAEETGVRASTWHELGWIWTTPGFCDERIWLYLASDLEPASQRLEHDELLEVVRMPLAEAVSLAEHDMPDAKSAIALLRAARWIAGGFAGPGQAEGTKAPDIAS